MKNFSEIKKQTVIRENSEVNKKHYQAKVIRTDKFLKIIRQNSYEVAGKLVVDLSKIEEMIKKIESKVWG